MTQRILLFLRTQFLSLKGIRSYLLKPGSIQNREPHLHKEEGPVKHRTEKGGSKEIIHKE